MLPCSRFQVPQHWPPTSVSFTDFKCHNTGLQQLQFPLQFIYNIRTHINPSELQHFSLNFARKSQPPYTGVKMTMLNALTARLSTVCSMRTAKPCKSSSFVLGPRSHGSVSRSSSKALGLKASSSFRVSAMAVYKVKLLGPNGEEAEFDAPDDVHILESAEVASLVQVRGMLYLYRAHGFGVGGSIGRSVPR